MERRCEQDIATGARIVVLAAPHQLISYAAGFDPPVRASSAFSMAGSGGVAPADACPPKAWANLASALAQHRRDPAIQCQPREQGGFEHMQS
jgi:hypothetical protein